MAMNKANVQRPTWEWKAIKLDIPLADKIQQHIALSVIEKTQIRMLTIHLLYMTFATLFGTVSAFPAYGSLAGLSREALDAIIPTLQIRTPASPPGPLNDTSAKLVDDAAHPW